MSDLLIAAYDNPSAAFAAGARLAALQRDSGAEPEDIVVVTRNSAGRVALHRSVDSDSGRPIGGGRWGVLIGMLFLDTRAPQANGQGLSDQLRTAGLDAGFLQDAASCLLPGGAAVGIHVRMLGAEHVRSHLAQGGGKPRILHQRLSAETEDALQDLQDQLPQAALGQTQLNGLF